MTTSSPSPNSPWGGPSRRGLRVRKRDDPGVDIFREAIEHLLDTDRVKRLLLELSRCYDPITNGPLLPAALRHRIIEALDSSRPDEARQLLEERVRLYATRGEPDSGGEGSQPRARSPAEQAGRDAPEKA